jgi:hypothetical protein
MTAGEGKTRVLQGAAIVMSDCREGEGTISRESYGYITDMAGPGSEITPRKTSILYCYLNPKIKLVQWTTVLLR